MKRSLLKTALSIFTALLLNSSASAQSAEVGTITGVSNYYGDLSPVRNNSKLFKQTVQLSQSRPAAGIFFRYNSLSSVNLRINVIKGQIAGDDKLSNNEWQKNRNLHFRSNILEYSFVAEFSILKRKQHLDYDLPYEQSIKRDYSLYAFGGLGILFFNPRANYNGNWYELQPLGTEGQGIIDWENQTVKAEHYSLTQISIPLGIGFNYEIFKKTKLGVELGFRKTFTDYLDDVSGNYTDAEDIRATVGAAGAALSNRSGESANGQNDLSIYTSGQKRGYSLKKDAYLIAGVMLSYTISN